MLVLAPPLRLYRRELPETSIENVGSVGGLRGGNGIELRPEVIGVEGHGRAPL
jgi:hypothetical protein